MSSSSTPEAWPSQHQCGSVTLDMDHFIEAPYDSDSIEQVSIYDQHRLRLAERRKPDRLVPREKGTKAGRSELEKLHYGSP
ncbi:hypothetical protein PFICI_01217 [Pestalotiopsis fici W106-1]|uniref:Uncharacterized protein n=1 Tax=Pestalotiopsis fici (strain W106-1 / CGMCC3.15140) TaxID=1229662 RepID=W3XN26_PESFW|nr:uncharacterized protein PFICI_01217 [Pestalotiopsis fici W106-1]ETS87389.1 hypothetical protein PFICI_01217 [Pestalotiopsis fici W106-1]